MHSRTPGFGLCRVLCLAPQLGHRPAPTTWENRKNKATLMLLKGAPSWHFWIASHAKGARRVPCIPWQEHRTSLHQLASPRGCPESGAPRPPTAFGAIPSPVAPRGLQGHPESRALQAHKAHRITPTPVPLGPRQPVKAHSPTQPMGPSHTAYRNTAISGHSLQGCPKPRALHPHIAYGVTLSPVPHTTYGATPNLGSHTAHGATPNLEPPSPTHSMGWPWVSWGGAQAIPSSAGIPCRASGAQSWGAGQHQDRDWEGLGTGQGDTRPGLAGAGFRRSSGDPSAEDWGNQSWWGARVAGKGAGACWGGREPGAEEVSGLGEELGPTTG